MLAMVARSSTERLSRPSPKYSTNFSTTPRFRSICVQVSTRSVAVTPSLSLPWKRKPITSGITMTTGWPSMAASASMPPTPQPSTPSAFTMVVWLSVPTQVSGKACVLPPRPPVHTDCARYSRFTWWQMPVPGGTTRKLLKAPAPQRRNS